VRKAKRKAQGFKRQAQRHKAKSQDGVNVRRKVLQHFACNLKYITVPDFETAFSRSRELERMLTSLIEKVKG
jgi:hypothetical protein